MEDDQKLYDSLDEEENCQEETQNFVLITEEKTSRTKDEPTTKFTDKRDAESDREKCDVSNVIPLYNGETIKSDIKLPKNKTTKKICSKTEIDGDSGRNNSVGNRMRQNSKADLLGRSVTYQKEKKSYLSLFHAKIGYPTDETLRETPDTTRAMCGDTSRTVSSTTTSTELFEDAQTDIINEENESDDSESFYIKHINNESKDSKINDTATTLKYIRSASFCSLSSSENSPLRSVSQQLLETNCKTTPKKKSSKKLPVPIPTLGYLGPDVEKNKSKLELLRKKLQYGQNVSDKNRIKFMEAKALSELKNQLKSGLTSRSSE